MFWLWYGKRGEKNSWPQVNLAQRLALIDVEIHPLLKNGKLGQFSWCFKATINGDAGHFPTPRNGHFPTPRFGHFPTPRNGQTPRFGHSLQKNGHFSTQLRKIKRGILTAAKILRNVAKKRRDAGSFGSLTHISAHTRIVTFICYLFFEWIYGIMLKFM